jgi:Fungal chitosanase of glycosyl hydrolase group 75
MKPLAVAAVVTVSICAHAQVPYKAPAESAATVSKVPFAEGHPIGEQFRALFNKCDERDTCSGKPQSCSSDKSHNAALLQLPGAVLFYEAKMAIDIDGSQLAARLYQERKQAGKSVIDQPDTSLRYSDGTSLDADTVPYIAVPGGNFRASMGIDKGDVAAVVYRDALSYALVGDVGPACKIGEGSSRLHEQLGHKACVARDSNGVCTRISNQSIETGVLYFVFPGSRNQIVPGLTPRNINERIKSLGPRLMQSLEKGNP